MKVRIQLWIFFGFIQFHNSKTQHNNALPLKQTQPTSKIYNLPKTFSNSQQSMIRPKTKFTNRHIDKYRSDKIIPRKLKHMSHFEGGIAEELVFINGLAPRSVGITIGELAAKRQKRGANSSVDLGQLSAERHKRAVNTSVDNTVARNNSTPSTVSTNETRPNNSLNDGNNGHTGGERTHSIMVAFIICGCAIIVVGVFVVIVLFVLSRKRKKRFNRVHSNIKLAAGDDKSLKSASEDTKTAREQIATLKYDRNL